MVVIDETHGKVTIGNGVEVAETAVLIGPCQIDDMVRISHGAVVGSPGEWRGKDPEWHHAVRICTQAELREHVVVQRGFVSDMVIGANALLMHGVHVGHDSNIHYHATLSPYVVLGGGSEVQQYVNLGIGAATHQNVTIGSYAMVGMGAVVLYDVPPGRKVVGVPARDIGPNTVGLERYGVGGVESVLRKLFEESSRRPAPE